MFPDLIEGESAESYAVSVAWHLGVLAERARIAMATAELDEVWRKYGATLLRNRRAELVADMEARAADWPGSTWKGRYPGGPVDFASGDVLVRRIGRAA